MSFDKTADQIMGATMAIISAVAVTGTVRALVIFVRMKYVHRKRFSHVSFLFINLIMTDLISGLFNSSFMALNLLTDKNNTQSNNTIFSVLCNTNGVSDVLSCQSSVLLNAIMSYGRYIAVCKSLRYNALITTKKIYIAVLVAWVYSMYLAILPYMWQVAYQYFKSIAMCSWYNHIFSVKGKPLQAFLFLTIISLPSLVPATIVLICCILIIYQLMSAISGTEGQCLSILCLPFRKKGAGDLQHAKRMELVDAARSVLKIVLVFLLCNFAWWIKMISDFLEFCGVIPLHWLKHLVGETTNHYFNRILKMLVLSNSAITPFLYSYTSSGTANQPVPPTVTINTTATRM